MERGKATLSGTAKAKIEGQEQQNVATPGVALTGLVSGQAKRSRRQANFDTYWPAETRRGSPC